MASRLAAAKGMAVLVMLAVSLLLLVTPGRIAQGEPQAPRHALHSSVCCLYCRVAHFWPLKDPSLRRECKNRVSILSVISFGSAVILQRPHREPRAYKKQQPATRQASQRMKLSAGRERSALCVRLACCSSPRAASCEAQGSPNCSSNHCPIITSACSSCCKVACGRWNDARQTGGRATQGEEMHGGDPRTAGRSWAHCRGKPPQSCGRQGSKQRL